ncbi:OB-fold protein [Myxococcus virescens]|uniref:tRNA_anti-like n=1 Tax=Myxococcus virescens TaxID=83456 RepID=A0A511HHD8_9BACT|nr:hypothetical protein [Myxococcus virescens]GEL72986.1 hypothetical protein MVI01_47700 [Myxococcus virescens]SDE07854.1 tRNA_anti-like [Myxococcus virescens]
MAMVKCKQCGNDVASNAAACPKCGAPPPRGMSALKVTFLVLGGVFSLCFFGTCMAGAIGAANKGTNRSGASSEGTSAATNRPPPKDVELRSLLSEYSDNEVRADSNFKDHVIQTAGIVDDVKKDIMNSVYITVGTGRQFEIPQVQCYVADDHVNKAANLSKGSRVKVRGRVQGLMMNVLVRDCEIVDL